MIQKIFLKEYFQSLRNLLNFDDDTIKKIIDVSDIIKKTDKTLHFAGRTKK